MLLREILEADAYRAGEAALPMALGKSIGGEPVVADLARMPHLLVAGTTGSGKSVGINAMILSLLYRHSPDECRFLMIDPKMLELSVYNGIPHLLTPVVTDPHKAVAALELGRRARWKSATSAWRSSSVRNIDVFNNRVRNAAEARRACWRAPCRPASTTAPARPSSSSRRCELEPMPLHRRRRRRVRRPDDRRRQGDRRRRAAAGADGARRRHPPHHGDAAAVGRCHHRHDQGELPDPHLASRSRRKIDSRTILNEQGAEQLLGQGDMLYLDRRRPDRCACTAPFVSDEEVEAHRRSAARAGRAALRRRHHRRRRAAADDDRRRRGARPGDDDLYDRAVAIVLRDRKASTSYIQRRLSIGYNRAADLIERMEREGLISPANGTGKREILVAGRDGGGAARRRLTRSRRAAWRSRRTSSTHSFGELQR